MSEALVDKLSSSFIVFENGLNGETRSALHQHRRAAMAHFELNGFPTTKLEEWKYTSLKPVLKHDYKLMPNAEHGLEFSEIKKYLLHDIDTYKIVFVNGRYSSWLSVTTHQNYDICTFSAALRRHRDLLDVYFNRAANPLSSTASLNTAFAQEGAFIHIPKGKVVDKPIEILHFTTEEAGSVLSQSRNLIVLEEGSEVQIIERHQNLGNHPVLSNAVSEVFVGPNARLELYRLQNDTSESALLDHTSIVQEADSRVHTGYFTFGGRLIRNDLQFAFEGRNAEAHLNGLSVLGDGQLADHHTLVDHKVPHCESHELYKGIYDGHSAGVFNGKIMVRPQAQKTNAFQQNNNILLGDRASVDTKPQLEIFADDVKCSHGCTVGQLDEEAMFYLRSRGIGQHEARALLLYAFGQEIIQRVNIRELRERLYRIMAAKLKVDFQLEL